MTPQRWDDDDMLLHDLAEALGDPDGLTALVEQQGTEVYGWRTVDEDLLLASLDFDSRVTPAANLRSGLDDPRVLVFTADPLSIELEVSQNRVAGQIVPAGVGRVMVETTAGTTFHVEADDLGFFVLPTLGCGPVRLRCETPTGRLVTTWVKL